MWEDFLLFVAVGLVAQMVDGAIGMAYGVTSTTVLLSFGVSPAMASACVHAAETFTTGHPAPAVLTGSCLPFSASPQAKYLERLISCYLQHD